MTEKDSENDFYADMYQSDEEEAVKPVSLEFPERGIANMPAMSAAIRRLEQTVADQSTQLAAQARQMRRQDALIRDLARKTGIAIRDLSDIKSMTEDRDY
jgi:hypothetical protein